MHRSLGEPRPLAVATRVLGSAFASIIVTVLITTGLAVATTSSSATSTGASTGLSTAAESSLAAQGFSLGEACANYRDAQAEGLNQDNARYLLAASRVRNLPPTVADSLRAITNSADPSALRPVHVEVSRFFNGACNNPRDAIGTACTLHVTLRSSATTQARLVAGQMHYALADPLETGEISRTIGDALAVIVASPADPTPEAQDQIEAANGILARELGAACVQSGATRGVALAATGLTRTSTAIMFLAFFLIFFGLSLTGMTRRLGPA